MTLAFCGHIKTFPIVADSQRNAARNDAKVNLGSSGPGVSDDVGEGFLKNKENLSPQVSTEGYVLADRLSAEFKIDVGRRKQLAGQTAHPLQEVAEMIFLRI